MSDKNAYSFICLSIAFINGENFRPVCFFNKCNIRCFSCNPLKNSMFINVDLAK